MRILYHHRIRSKDGQYVHLEELTRALSQLGHELMILGPSAVEKDEFGAEAGFVDVLKRRLPQVLYEILEFAYSFWACARLWRSVKRFRPDCLYERYNLFLPSGVWIKRLCKLPMLLEVNAPIVEERGKYNGLALIRFARWIEQYTWRGSDFALPVTNVLAERLRKAGVPESHIVVIHNGVNREEFWAVADRKAAKRALGLEDRLVLGFTGFVREWHGMERIIGAMAQCASNKSLHLLLVGDGPARAPLETLARKLNVTDRLTITGIIGRDRVPEYVSAFDIALQPAVVPYASPLKLFEYMAMAIAIIAPAQENIKEILTDGFNALLFRPDHVNELWGAVETLCNDDNLRDLLGQRARATILQRGLTWEANAQRVVELFHQAGVPRPKQAGESAPAGR